MKKIIATFNLLFNFAMWSLAQGVSISSPTSIPDQTAILDIKSSSKGLLIPRLTSQQRINIITPANGLIVYDTELKSIIWFNGTGWQTASGTSNQPKDSGYIVIYTQTAMTDSIDILINDNYVGNINPGVVVSNSVPAYGQARTISLKWPVGNFYIKGSTSKFVNRATTGNVLKDDTIKVKLDYSYTDSYSANYYIESLAS